MHPNETLDSIVSRRSVRAFASMPVPHESLEKLIEMASYAPSPLNNQPWRFLVTEDRSVIRKISNIVDERVSSIEKDVHEHMRMEYHAYRGNATFFKEAAALIIVLLKPMTSDARGHRWGVPGFFSNEREVRGDIMCIGAACQNILLAARSLGLGTCMMLYPLIANEPVREMLDIRAPWEVMAYIPVGFPDGPLPEMPKRRDLGKIVRYIKG
jgi:F420 biosynthesis protein FbiB-like protein